MKRFVISILASLPMMAMADVTGVLESAVTEVVESDSVPSLDAVQIDSMANHYLKQVIEDEKKENMSIFAFDDPERQKKHPWKAAVETFGINVLVLSFDRYVLDADFAQISLNSIKHNIKNGFVWDNDQFSTNLFAHPYHGGLYFHARRSNGINF